MSLSPEKGKKKMKEQIKRRIEQIVEESDGENDVTNKIPEPEYRQKRINVKNQDEFS